MSAGWILGTALAIAADVMVGPDLRIFGARLELGVALLCLAWLKNISGADLLLCAWGLGLWRDTFSVGAFGVYGLAFLSLIGALEYLRGAWAVENFFMRAGVMMAGILWTAAVAGAVGAASIGWGAAASALVTTGLVAGGIEAGRRIHWWWKPESRLSRA